MHRRLARPRLRTLLVVALIYGLLWLATGFFGSAQIRDIALHKMREMPPSWTDISVPPATPPHGPTYYARAVAYAPFLVRAEHG